MSDEGKEALLQSGHTPVSNRPDGEDFAIEATIVEESLAEEMVEEAALPGDGIEVAGGAKRPAVDTASAFTTPDVELRDIGEASFGSPPAFENVHGPDDRTKIQDTDEHPWRMIASLQITARDGSGWVGTGWFIGPHTLMTAGHCVYIKDSGVPGRDGWVKEIKVMPGRRGTVLPYGSVMSTSFRTVVGWADRGDPFYDYGAIIIPTDLGYETRWFGFGAYSGSTLRNTTGNLVGYPGDKPPGTLWQDRHKIAVVSPRRVFYDMDTYGGQSGSPVYRVVDGKHYAFAIHNYGHLLVNSGTRIGTPVFKNMFNWKK